MRADERLEFQELRGIGNAPKRVTCSRALAEDAYCRLVQNGSFSRSASVGGHDMVFGGPVVWDRWPQEGMVAAQTGENGVWGIRGSRGTSLFSSYAVIECEAWVIVITKMGFPCTATPIPVNLERSAPTPHRADTSEYVYIQTIWLSNGEPCFSASGWLQNRRHIVVLDSIVVTSIRHSHPRGNGTDQTRPHAPVYEPTTSIRTKIRTDKPTTQTPAQRS